MVNILLWKSVFRRMRAFLVSRDSWLHAFKNLGLATMSRLWQAIIFHTGEIT